jgi:hypothetical protein
MMMHGPESPPSALAHVLRGGVLSSTWARLDGLVVVTKKLPKFDPRNGVLYVCRRQR